MLRMYASFGGAVSFRIPHLLLRPSCSFDEKVLVQQRASLYSTGVYIGYGSYIFIEVLDLIPHQRTTTRVVIRVVSRRGNEPYPSLRSPPRGGALLNLVLFLIEVPSSESSSHHSPPPRPTCHLVQDGSESHQVDPPKPLIRILLAQTKSPSPIRVRVRVRVRTLLLVRVVR